MSKLYLVLALCLTGAWAAPNKICKVEDCDGITTCENGEDEMIMHDCEKINTINFISNNLKTPTGPMVNKPVHIHNLSLEMNLLTTLNKEMFSTMSVEILRLNFNMIKDVPVDALEPIKGTLKRLEMQDNDMSNIDFVKPLTNLEYLDVMNNHIKTIDPTMFENMPNMESLFVGTNKLTNMEFLKPLIKLKELDMDGNKMEEMDEHMMEGMKDTLETLTCSGNKLKDVKFLKPLTKLKSLVMNNMDLTEIPADTFMNSKDTMTGLSLSGNKLTNFDCIKPLTNLEELSLSFNDLTKIDADMMMPMKNKMKTLNVNDNMLTNVDFMKPLTKLETVDMSDNKITNMDGVLANCQNTLVDIDANNNSLSTMSAFEGAEKFPKLKKLGMAMNEIKEVDFTNKNYANLEMLELTNNDISKVGTVPEAMDRIVLLDNKFTNAESITPMLANKKTQIVLSPCDFAKDMEGVRTFSFGNEKQMSCVINPKAEMETIISFLEMLQNSE